MFTIVILFSIFHVYIFFQLPRYGALVFIDECHATGFLGETGRGTEEYFGMKGQVDIINSTLGKALGGIFSLYPYTNYAGVFGPPSAWRSHDPTSTQNPRNRGSD